MSVIFLWEVNAVFESVYFSVGTAKVLLKGDMISVWGGEG